MPGTPPTRPRARRPRHDPRDSEREILDAAERLLRELPYREVTVQAIMRETGLKRPAFYAHFRDRNELVLRVVQDIGTQLFAVSDRWLRGAGGRGDVRVALEGVATVYVQHGAVLRALVEAAPADARIETAYRDLVGAFVEATGEHIATEQAHGAIDPELDARETARALVWLNERYLTEALARAPLSDSLRVVAVLERIWVATLYGGGPRSAH